MEITEQLSVMRCKVFFPMFTLDQDYRLAVFMNGIVDLFPFFNSQITSVFGDNLRRIKDIVSESLKKRHNERRFGCLFSLGILFKLDNPFTQELDLILKVHMLEVF